jgi:hypothetical protein
MGLNAVMVSLVVGIVGAVGVASIEAWPVDAQDFIFGFYFSTYLLT